MPNAVKSTKERIIDAASRQFGDAGDISMRNVADDVGLTATALYHHFRGKRELLDAVADRGFGLFESRLRSPGETDPQRIIHGILGQYKQFAADHPALFGLMFVEPRRSARKFPVDFAAHRLAVFNSLWKAVAECMQDGSDGSQIDPDESLHLAHDIWALTHGQILLWRAGRFVDDATFREVLTRSIDAFIDTL